MINNYVEGGKKKKRKDLHGLNKCFYICSRFGSKVVLQTKENLQRSDSILIFAVPNKKFFEKIEKVSTQLVK